MRARRGKAPGTSLALMVVLIGAALFAAPLPASAGGAYRLFGKEVCDPIGVTPAPHDESIYAAVLKAYQE